MRQALERLYRLGPGRMFSGRDRLRRLLAQAANPHLAIPSVLVGGTNGKGSLVAALSAVLTASGLTTGAFIKPHLKTIRERWRIDDQPVTEDRFTACANQTCDLVEACHEPISFFEANVLLGSLLFRDQECDVAIWEIGLGGKEDACNLVDPRISALTNVGFDHQAILGDTLPAIARDKAHIARSGRPLIVGPPRPGWEDAYLEYAPVVGEVARELGGQLITLDKTEAPGWPFDQGPLQADTALLLQAVLSHLPEGWVCISDHSVAAGLERFHYPARLQRTYLRGAPVILDAAHNADSLRWLRLTLSGKTAAAPRLNIHRSGMRYRVVFGCQATRDPATLLAELKPVTDTLVPIEVPVMRPCPLPSIIDAAAANDIPVANLGNAAQHRTAQSYALGHVTELDPPDNRTGWIERVEHALSLATEEQPTVICGSIYYLGEILRVFEE